MRRRNPVRLVVSIVPARVQVHLRGRGIDTMWRRSCTAAARPAVVCLVVLIVVAREVQVSGADVARRPVLFHVQPPTISARLAAERSPSLIIRAIEYRRHGCRLVNGFVNETRRDRGDDVERPMIAPHLRPLPATDLATIIVARRSTGLDHSSHVELVRDCATTQFARVEIVHVDGSSVSRPGGVVGGVSKSSRDRATRERIVPTGLPHTSAASAYRRPRVSCRVFCGPHPNRRATCVSR